MNRVRRIVGHLKGSSEPSGDVGGDVDMAPSAAVSSPHATSGRVLSPRGVEFDDDDVVILGACRTPIGAFLGSLSKVPATELGSVAIAGALRRAHVPAEHVDEVFMGNVLSASLGQAPARQAALGAGLPATVPCTTVNKVCSSGMKSVACAYQALLSGCGKQVIVAGGMENMSRTPYVVERGGQRLGHSQLSDLLIKDGLWDPYNQVHMGVLADKVASNLSISREAQDDYAVRSYSLSQQAAATGAFSAELEPVPVKHKKAVSHVDHDEEPSRVDFVKLRHLRPAFSKSASATVTAGNASTIADGASCMVLATGHYARTHGLVPLARIVSVADAARIPAEFPIAPADAAHKALELAKMSIDDMHAIEINEAFAAVVLANVELLGIDMDKVNKHGGGISLGHPLGCSANRIVVALLSILERQQYGLATVCNGGGGASALILEKLV